MKLPKKLKLNPVFIIEDDLKKILAEIENETVNEIVTFAFYTGLRLGRIVNLGWSNIDWENNVSVVDDEEFIPKGKNQRNVPICEMTQEVLK